MKLPNFLQSEQLNSLRARMGIPQDVFGNLNVIIDPARLSEVELERLSSQDGIEIDSIDDIRILNDGTLAYKNSRVLLYIRDHQVYGDRNADPKFHVANCDTLVKMKKNKRFERYVVAARLDGRFRINLIVGPQTKSEVRRLSVCQNCLNHLEFDGFQMTMAKLTRIEQVKTFEIKRFFELYPQNLHTEKPIHDSESAPLNDYAQDFSQKSNKIRAEAGWSCQNPDCRIWLGLHDHRKFLHVHHINGLKTDDRPSNLDVLCIECHSNEPQHGHMKGLPEYKQFIKIRATIPKAAEVRRPTT